MGYLASNADLITAFGNDTSAATQHYVNNGYGESSTDSFDEWSYLASTDSFDEWSYLASNGDLLQLLEMIPLLQHSIM